MKEKYKEFKPTSWAMTIQTAGWQFAIYGFITYSTIPKEQIPEIVIPYIMVSTVYPGTSPTDMENFVTRPLEKNMKSIEDVKEITSSSVQDFSDHDEFNTGLIPEAKQRVKDAVDRTKAIFE
jgi:multidrug efflux pump subunit AcrB